MKDSVASNRGRLPFILLFEEPAPEPKSSLEPIYDEATGISYIKDAKGLLVPFVQIPSIEGTETFTRIEKESNDSDQQPTQIVLSTSTATAVKGEETDADPDGSEDSSTWPFGTSTETFVVEETTDSDDEDQSAAIARARVLLATETATKANGEISDPDEET